MASLRALLTAALFVAGLVGMQAGCVVADEHTHTYEDKEEVVIWVNTVGPYRNLQETYEYYQLPYCQGNKELDHHHETLGEALQGIELVSFGAAVYFGENVKPTVICEKILTSKEVYLFRYAVANSYWFQMILDDLPIYGFVGEVDQDNNHMLFTRKDFVIGYNGDQIVEVKLTSSEPVALEVDTEIKVSFQYSVTWVPSDTPFSQRFEKYLDSEFFEHKIHWFSIFNSFMIILFLTGLVALILVRTLRKDYARYDNKEDGLTDMERELGDEYGWKQIHGDVFRPPPHLGTFSAFLGSGVQLAILTFTAILYTIIGDLYEERASILSVTIGLYILTSFIGGYTSGSYYARYGGKNWVRTMIVTASLWPGVLTVGTLLINFIAISYKSAKAIPFVSMIYLLCIWLFLIFPLTLFGTIVGRNWSGLPDFPCRVNPIPRPIPEKSWFADPLLIIVLGGVLPFCSIFIETYFVMSSFWEYKIYYVYGFMMLVFLILLIVTSCAAVVASYILLNAEDHRCGSTSAYVYLYAIYYFFARTKMYGLFQTSFYFGYTGMICFGLFVLLGTVGHFAANLFIRQIFSTVKID